MSRNLVDIAGAGVYLATSESHLRRLVHERRIPFVKVGHKLRFDVADLDAWLDANRTEALT